MKRRERVRKLGGVHSIKSTPFTKEPTESACSDMFFSFKKRWGKKLQDEGPRGGRSYGKNPWAVVRRETAGGTKSAWEGRWKHAHFNHRTGGPLIMKKQVGWAFGEKGSTPQSEGEGKIICSGGNLLKKRRKNLVGLRWRCRSIGTLEKTRWERSIDVRPSR